MRRITMALFLAAAGSLQFAAAASEGPYEKAMKEALTAHDVASDYQGEVKAAQAFAAAGDKFTKEWLPYYWSAYIHTQLANIHGRAKDAPQDTSPAQLLQESQRYLDKAYSRVSNKNGEIESSFNALQHLIYSFQGRYSRSPDDRKSFNQKADEEFKAAVRNNPHNPLVYVLAATDMVRRPKDLNSALAGRVLLETAKRLFSEAKRDRSLTTHWNAEWIWLYWLEHSERMVKNLSASQ